MVILFLLVAAALGAVIAILRKRKNLMLFKGIIIYIPYCYYYKRVLILAS